MTSTTISPLLAAFFPLDPLSLCVQGYTYVCCQGQVQFGTNGINQPAFCETLLSLHVSEYPVSCRINVPFLAGAEYKRIFFLYEKYLFCFFRKREKLSIWKQLCKIIHGQEWLYFRKISAVASKIHIHAIAFSYQTAYDPNLETPFCFKVLYQP